MTRDLTKGMRTEENVQGRPGGGEQRTRHLKANFVDQDKAQKDGYIKDLEKTIMINKQIIAQLLAGDAKSDPKDRATIAKINEESIHLQTLLKTVTKERDEIQAKLLISEQIIEDARKKEQDLIQDYEKQLQSAFEQLDMKDYNIQEFLYKLQNIQTTLNKAGSKDGRRDALLEELSQLLTAEKPLKSSNVIEENAWLTQELQEERQRNTELEARLHELNIRNENCVLAINELKAGGASSASMDLASLNKKLRIPPLDLTKVRRPGNRPISEPGYIHKLEESIKLLNARISELEEKNKELMQKNMQLENTNANLFTLNEKLSKSYQLALKKRPLTPFAQHQRQAMNRTTTLNFGTRTEHNLPRDNSFNLPTYGSKEEFKGSGASPIAGSPLRDKVPALLSKAETQCVHPRLLLKEPLPSDELNKETPHLASNPMLAQTAEAARNLRSHEDSKGLAKIVTTQLPDSGVGEERLVPRTKEERTADLPSDHVTGSTAPSGNKRFIYVPECVAKLKDTNESFGQVLSLEEKSLGKTQGLNTGAHIHTSEQLWT